MRKRVYLAGPISRGDLAHNVNQATAAFIELAKAGFAPFCPQWSVFSGGCWNGLAGVNVIAFGTVAGDSRMSHADWLGVDLPWVGVSDAVLRLPGESTGADMEVDFARLNRVPVFQSVKELIEHFQFHREAA